ncbi:MAG: hypothetical protein J0L94_02740 [Rhodothermia bacterium]|nr:hypothetical protein [Rhodothermia bacterium]
MMTIYSIKKDAFSLRLMILPVSFIMLISSSVLAQPMSLAQADEIFFPLIFKAYVKREKPNIFERLRTKEPTIKIYIDPLILDSSASILLSDKRKQLIQKNKIPKQSFYIYRRCSTLENYISFLPNEPKYFERIEFYNTNCKPLIPYVVILISEPQYNVNDKSWEAYLDMQYSMGLIQYKVRLKKSWWGKWKAKFNVHYTIQI